MWIYIEREQESSVNFSCPPGMFYLKILDLLILISSSVMKFSAYMKTDTEKLTSNLGSAISINPTLSNLVFKISGHFLFDMKDSSK